jgi:polar amino acid transport system substrate-binding protein
MIYLVKAVLSALLVLLVSNASANQSILVVTDLWPPYVKKTDSGLGGLSTPIVIKALMHANVEFEIQVLPWARAYHIAQNRKNTLIFTIVRTQMREKKFKWISRLHPKDATYLYSLSENLLAVKSIEEAKGHIVAVHRNSMASERLQELGFKINKNLYQVDTNEQALKLLQNKRIQLIAATESNIRHMIKQKSDINLKMRKSILLMNSDLYVAFSLQTDDNLVRRLRDSFDAVLNAKATN